jgi:hypothetical protein
MSNEEETADGGAVADQPGISFAWERVPRGKVQVQARFVGTLFHCAAFRVDDAKERARFGKQVAARALERFGVEVGADALEQNLLAIIDDMASHQEDEGFVSPAEYQAVEGDEAPDRNGIYAAGPNGPVQLSNVILYIDRDIMARDGSETRRRFEGRAILHGVTSPFAIDAGDYGNGNRLAAAVFAAAGPRVQILCRPEVLGRAISAISEPTSRVITTDFGWGEGRDSYLTPSVRIDASGVHPTTANDPVRVSLEVEPCARHLDLAVPAAKHLDSVSL